MVHMTVVEVVKYGVTTVTRDAGKGCVGGRHGKVRVDSGCRGLWRDWKLNAVLCVLQKTES